MKIPCLLVMMGILSLPLSRAQDDERVSREFLLLYDRIRQSDPEFVTQLHERAARELRQQLQAGLEKDIESDPGQLEKTGLPQNYKELKDLDFLRKVFGRIFLKHLDQFNIQEGDIPRIHGVVYDDGMAILVYSFGTKDRPKTGPRAICMIKVGTRWQINQPVFLDQVMGIWRNSSKNEIRSSTTPEDPD